MAHKIGPAQLDRLITEAKARFDPEQTEAERAAAAETRHFDINLAQAAVAGTVRVDGELDLADALDLEAAVAADAQQLRLLGSTESLDVRRSIAVGDLARGQQTLDLAREDGPTRRRPRRVVLHVHLEHAAVLGAGGLAHLHEVPGPITAEQVRHWCASPDAQVTVQPVLDLAEHLHVNSYHASARLKPDPASRPHLRLPFLLPPRRAVRLRAPGRPRRRRADVHLQPRTVLPPPPPRKDHRRLELRRPSNPASISGAARWATSSSATTPAPSTSPPTPNGAV